MKSEELEFPNFIGDFIPYIEKINSETGTFDYWTGFYSTYPMLKQRIKQTFQRLRNVEIRSMIENVRKLETGQQLNSLESQDTQTEISNLKQKLSILLHHDAITCTSPKATIKDYVLMLNSINENLKSLESDQHESYLGEETDENLIHPSYKMIQIFNPSAYT